MRIKAKLSLFLCIVCVCVLISGCSLDSTPEEPFVMAEGMDAPQYMLFLDKELADCHNKITSVILMARAYVAGTGSYKNLADEIDSAVEVFDAAADKITVITPAPQYSGNRERILALLKDSVNSLQMLKEKAADGTAGVQETISELTAMFIALTGETGVYYK